VVLLSSDPLLKLAANCKAYLLSKAPFVYFKPKSLQGLNQTPALTFEVGEGHEMKKQKQDREMPLVHSYFMLAFQNVAKALVSSHFLIQNVF
jgi:hypothetical protein